MKQQQTPSAADTHAHMQKTPFSPGGLSLTGSDSTVVFNPPLTFTHTHRKLCPKQKNYCPRMQPVLSGCTTARHYYWPDLAFSNCFLQPGALRDRFIAPHQFPCPVFCRQVTRRAHTSLSERERWIQRRARRWHIA